MKTRYRIALSALVLVLLAYAGCMLEEENGGIGTSPSAVVDAGVDAEAQ